MTAAGQPELTPAQRSLRSRIASGTRWAAESDRPAATAPARRSSPGSLDYWLIKVDPDGEMSATDRHAAAISAHKAHMARLAYASSRARQRRAKPRPAIETTRRAS